MVGRRNDPGRSKKIFWYLKRKTSYTAWARLSGAFDDFSAVFKEHVTEQPLAPGPVFGPFNWEWRHIEILKAQVLFELGLARLRKGDRSGWLCHDRGIPGDACWTGAFWFAELTYGGERQDHAYFGKYADQMKAMIGKVDEAQRIVGYLQPRMYGTPAPDSWGEWMECVLHDEVFPRNPDPGFPRWKPAAPLAFPDPLPAIPATARELRINTGELILSDGIYEPQVRDGCMNYLVTGAEAASLGDARGVGWPVVWKLIWEDARYIDGEIPAEESSYFPSDSANEAVPSAALRDVLYSVTGEVCSRDGV